MATLYVAEFERPRNQWVNIGNAPPVVEQTVAIGGASAQSSMFGGTNGTQYRTALIRVVSDAICSIAFGTNPTATTSNMRLSADEPEYFSVSPNMKIAVISNV